VKRRLYVLGLILAAISGGANDRGANGSSDEQSVAVKFYYNGTGLGQLTLLYEFSDALNQLITKSGLGEYDGLELATDVSRIGHFYMRGPDADRLITLVKPALPSAPLL
jgi:hypothetical protein